MLDWQGDQLNVDSTKEILEQQQPESLVITRIPDKRTLLNSQALDLLSGDSRPENRR